jgi:hypothetical protein
MVKKRMVHWSGMTLAMALAAAGCTSCGKGSETNCGNNGSTSNDAVICPAASPIVIVADPVTLTGSYALNVFNESKSKNLEITDVAITGDNAGDHPELFTNLLISDKTVKPGDVTLVQFTWAVTELTVEERRANLHIKSNAKNYEDLNIIILLRSRIPASTSSSGGAATSHASSAAGASSAGASSAQASSAAQVSSSAAPASSAAVESSSAAVESSSAAAESSSAAPASSAAGNSSSDAQSSS